MDLWEIGYLAGILDGEGCVYVNRRKVMGNRKTPGYSLKVVVSITSERLVDWLKDRAKLTSIFRAEANEKTNRKAKWLCTWNNTAAEWILKLTLPYLIIKKDQANLGLELIKHLSTTKGHRGVCVPQEAVEYRELIKKKISILNRRGYSLATEAEVLKQTLVLDSMLTEKRKTLFENQSNRSGSSSSPEPSTSSSSESTSSPNSSASSNSGS